MSEPEDGDTADGTQFGQLHTDISTPSQHTKGNKQAEDEANKEADEKIKEIQTSGKKNQTVVITDLLNGVLDVKPVPPSAA